MYKRLNKCPLCGSTDHENYMITKDHFLTKEDFHLSKCRNCMLVFTNPIPSSNRLPEYYQSDNYKSHHTKFDLYSVLYKLLRLYNISYKQSVVKKYTSKYNRQSILDYGCGTGSFLRSCKKYYSYVVGIEPDTEARAQAINISKEAVYSTLSELDQTEKFDVITLWHVLEHVETLNELVKDLRSRLKKEGKLIVAVPNLDSYDAQFFQGYWAALDVPRHLHHFTGRTIRELFKNHRLKLVGSEPLKLDAYYISDQSIYYKSKRKNLFQALKTGYLSNKSGDKTGNYSSNIYVFEKYK